MESERPSPFTKASCGTGRPFTGRPSTRAMSGVSEREPSAIAIALCVARRMLISSISSGPIRATLQTTAGFPMISAQTISLRRFVSFFESSSSGQEKDLGRMTAAAATGPAKGPLPASSTPATRANPRVAKSCTNAKSGTVYHVLLNGSAASRWDVHGGKDQIIVPMEGGSKQRDTWIVFQ